MKISLGIFLLAVYLSASKASAMSCRDAVDDVSPFLSERRHDPSVFESRIEELKNEKENLLSQKPSKGLKDDLAWTEAALETTLKYKSLASDPYVYDVVVAYESLVLSLEAWAWNKKWETPLLEISIAIAKAQGRYAERIEDAQKLVEYFLENVKDPYVSLVLSKYILEAPKRSADDNIIAHPNVYLSHFRALSKVLPQKAAAHLAAALTQNRSTGFDANTVVGAYKETRNELTRQDARVSDEGIAELMSMVILKHRPIRECQRLVIEAQYFSNILKDTELGLLVAKSYYKVFQRPLPGSTLTEFSSLHMNLRAQLGGARNASADFLAAQLVAGPHVNRSIDDLLRSRQSIEQMNHEVLRSPQHSVSILLSR